MENKFGEFVKAKRQEKEISLRNTETFRINKKQNAVHLSVFQQTIHTGNCGVGFARARRHLHQRSRAVIRKGIVKIFLQRLSDTCGSPFRQAPENSSYYCG